ncbi:MAG: LptF/LptG family permease [Geminicoccaceae bacterium]
MSVLTRYLNRMFLVRLAVVMFAIMGFAIVVDLLDVAEDLAREPGGALPASLRYVGLRLPIMFSELLPVASLIAGLLAVADLLRHRELVVIWSSGVRPITVLRLLLPAGLLLVGAKFAVDDIALPRATTALRTWGIGEYRHQVMEGQSGPYYWLRSGADVVRVSANAVSAGALRDVTVFRRDPAGILTERLDAPKAEVIAGGWRLLDVTQRIIAGRQIAHLPTLDLPEVVDLEHIQLMARPPRELTLLQLGQITAAGGYGLRAIEPYRTWMHQRIAGAFIPMLLMMLAFALVRSFSRTASIAPVFLTAVGTGFTFLIVGGVASALGEVGLLSPLLAAWSPTVVLATIVLGLALRDGAARPRPAGVQPVGARASGRG